MAIRLEMRPRTHAEAPAELAALFHEWLEFDRPADLGYRLEVALWGHRDTIFTTGDWAFWLVRRGDLEDVVRYSHRTVPVDGNARLLRKGGRR